MMPGREGRGLARGGGGGGGVPVDPYESSQDTSRDVSPLSKGRGGDQRDAMDRYVKMASFGTQLSTQERVLKWRAHFGNSSGGSRCSTGILTHTPTRTRTCTHSHTHSHTHMHMHMHIHTHTHTQREGVCACARWGCLSFRI